MILEYSYRDTCKEIEMLQGASVTDREYLILEDNDWWKSIPAEVIPMRTGIYSQESRTRQKTDLDELVDGKILGDIQFEQIHMEPLSIVMILGSEEDDCGLTTDNFHLNAVLLADFDGDGIVELLLHRFRAYQSETCSLGSGNYLGGWSTIILNKDNPSDAPSILDE